ncbi:lysosome membrane protein 2 [Teleopsis dalmanni]|uniref:lysosome membrane protein 2 n=1 Tax=Teleopsis dalmanni TaxID=139649 RepID=UPI000D32CB7A|nr:lysosome membrane protein 2 [Teleopsis dalmanni]XP_037954965.1 lysosome membrane protein 2 [Teleopsis dalmanni]XP_037954966.1 lysosome membrane protein 2 [Teleopsis dalmanni]
MNSDFENVNSHLPIYNDRIKEEQESFCTHSMDKNNSSKISAELRNSKKSESLFNQIVAFNKRTKDQQQRNELGTFILLGVMFLLFVISATGLFVMWFTEYYNDTMLSNIVLAENSETAESWKSPQPKYDTLLKVHIFNYTNIKEYLLGLEEKIKVEDIGPLTYREHTTKVNVSFNKNFTVTFRDHRSYEFLPEKSTCGQHDTFILPNVPLLTAAVKIEKMNRFKKLGATGLINSFKEDVFKRLTAHNFLWGYRDRIVALDFGTGNTHFGLLMNRNGTSVDSLQINTGVDDIRKFSTITQFNGMPTMDFWSEPECNRIDGSDASMFPPYLIENRTQLNVFLQVLCRKVPLEFEKEVTIFDDIDALRYRTPLTVFGNPQTNLNNACYCHNTEKCLPSGVINATKCYNGAPIYPSFPHFFSGDKEVYKHLEGINPDANLHQTFADIHPRFAFPIGGASRIQINIAVQKTNLIKRQIERFEDFTILPLIWIEITPSDYTEEIISKLYISTVGINAIQLTLKYGTLLVCIVSFSLIIAASYSLNKKRLNQLEKDGEKDFTAKYDIQNAQQRVFLNEYSES